MTIIIGVAALAIVIGLLALWAMRRRGLSASDSKALLRAWEKAAAHKDLHRKILDADTVICEMLGRLGYQGSMGDRLKKAGPRIRNVQRLWDAHKLRNRIAHEPGFEANASETARALSSFESTLRQFIK